MISKRGTDGRRWREQPNIMAEGFQVGDRVVVHGKTIGTVRYVGSVHYSRGDDWCGVEVDEVDV